MTTAPYGSWPSPITPELLAGGGVGLSGGLVDGDDVYWLVADPNQKGRVTLNRRPLSSPATSPEPPPSHQTPGPPESRAQQGLLTRELTPDHNLRSRVHEYGGMPFTALGGTVVYTDFASQNVYVLDRDQAPRAIATVPGLRYGGFALVPGRRQVLAVREDHRDTSREPVDTIVVLDLDGDNPTGGDVLAAGADFYYAPQVSSGHDVVWFEWDHPNMPWDATRINARALDGGPVRAVAGDGTHSFVHPSFAPDGSILHLSDESGFWNLRRFGQSAPLHDHRFDFCGPAWVLQPPPYAPLADGSVGVSWLEGGQAHVGLLRPDGGLEEFRLPVASAELSPGDPRSVVHLGFTDRPAGLHVLDWSTGLTTELAQTSHIALDPGFVSRPEDITWSSPDGDVHAWYYPPAHPDHTAPDGELPPVLVQSHGGPTSYSAPGFDLKKLFWTSRGIGVLDVNYGGSTGYGRAYRERLKANWGVVDVRDCAQAPLELARRGLADPKRLAIEGGSAGGFTTLACLAFTDTFAAGISRYGIGDLETLATDTHKFEARYLDGLIAPYPEGRATYLARSPLCHLDGLACPMLILQGEDDPVVPPQQARDMAAAVERKGLPVTLVVYPGEGHGFRQAATIKDQYERMLEFLGRVFGF